MTIDSNNYYEFSKSLSEYMICDNKFVINTPENNNIHIPALGQVYSGKIYELSSFPEFKETSDYKVFIGNNKFRKISGNIFLRIEGNTNYFSNEWYISIIKKINKRYSELFGVINPLYIQITQYLPEDNEPLLYGGMASSNAIEIFIRFNFPPSKDSIKWLIAHELLHLYFPSIPQSEKSLCWNEGLNDYLALYLNFTKKKADKLLRAEINEINEINGEYHRVRTGFTKGLIISRDLTGEKIEKIIEFIRDYVEQRDYMLQTVNNLDFVREMGYIW